MSVVDDHRGRARDACTDDELVPSVRARTFYSVSTFVCTPSALSQDGGESLGTALLPYGRPRVLLIDEIDKSDIDLPNDLLTIFEKGEYDLVELAYTQFLSAATQKVAIRRFVPLDASMLTPASDGPPADYEFEPNPQEILDRLLPRYAEARLYAALLEGSASFFAAQQRAMKSATDNAEELIIKYSRAMNRARQDAITTEIMEIVGGAEAMRAAQSDGSDLLIDRVLTSADVLTDSLNRSRS